MMSAEYRIRWAHVQGPWHGTRRMCMAERRNLFLGLFPMWWPLWRGDWRFSEAEAENDIIDDQTPLPKPRRVAAKSVG